MYATPAELKGLLRRPDLADDDATLSLCLRGATAVIDGYCGQLIGNITETVELLGGGSFVTLPGFPVSNVTSVTENGTLLTEGSYQWTTDGILTRLGGHVWGSKVEVTYTYGVGATPADIQLVCLSLAARYYLNPGGLKQETLAGGYSASYAANELAPGERAILDRFRLEQA